MKPPIVLMKTKWLNCQPKIKRRNFASTDQPKPNRYLIRSYPSPESQSVQIAFEWTEGGDEDVESEVELAAADEQRVVDVLGDDVRVFGRGRAERVRARVARPLLQLR